MPKLYGVNEIFYSIQGEGAMVGKPVVFVRFRGCNLFCEWCDTPHETGVLLTGEEILDEAHQVGGRCQAVIFTGGEPTLQLDNELLRLFRLEGWWLGIETNGTLPLPRAGFNHITVSPKRGTILDLGAERRATEWRFPIVAGDPCPNLPQTGKDFFLSPVFDGLKLNPANLKHALDLCQREPEWRLSIQIHKLINVP